MSLEEATGDVTIRNQRVPSLRLRFGLVLAALEGTPCPSWTGYTCLLQEEVTMAAGCRWQP